jgi:hypothetical protein
LYRSAPIESVLPYLSTASTRNSEGDCIVPVELFLGNRAQHIE